LSQPPVPPSRNPIDQHLKHTGHYPRCRLQIGKRRFVQVEVMRGYVAISAPPQGPIYVPRRQLVKLLKWLLPLLTFMDRDFSMEDSIHEYHQEEMRHLAGLRAQKRARR
jgi:hypothetical protein